MLQDGLVSPGSHWQVADLLPAGLAALEWMEKGLAQGCRVFKWKVGVFDFEQERGVFRQLMQRLPEGGLLRLDANGSWDLHLAERWLRLLEEYPGVDFVEQALAPKFLSDMQHLQSRFRTPLALDESVSTGRVMAELSWSGIVVVKPALLGDLTFFEDWISRADADWVFSSSFETAIGVENMLSLLHRVGCSRPLGFGVDKFYVDDGLSLHRNTNGVTSGQVAMLDLEAVWQEARE